MNIAPFPVQDRYSQITPLHSKEKTVCHNFSISYNTKRGCLMLCGAEIDPIRNSLRMFYRSTANTKETRNQL